MLYKSATNLLLLQSSVLRGRGFHGNMRMAQAHVSAVPKYLTTSSPSSFVNVYLVPMFQDNYGFIIVDKESKVSACIDPGDGKVIKQALDALKIGLDYILCTHKHDDHIGGVAELLKDFPSAVVIATQYEDIPEADRDVGEGETFHLGKLPVQVTNSDSLFHPPHRIVSS
jgi:glyoxylase-like metal-dependent hydrolase (beta-lactamase superfamily II)